MNKVVRFCVFPLKYLIKYDPFMCVHKGLANFTLDLLNTTSDLFHLLPSPHQKKNNAKHFILKSTKKLARIRYSVENHSYLNNIFLLVFCFIILLLCCCCIHSTFPICFHYNSNVHPNVVVFFVVSVLLFPHQ